MVATDNDAYLGVGTFCFPIRDWRGTSAQLAMNKWLQVVAGDIVRSTLLQNHFQELLGDPIQQHPPTTGIFRQPPHQSSHVAEVHDTLPADCPW